MTIIKLDCDYCGELSDARTLVIADNRILSECTKCGHTTIVWGVPEKMVTGDD